MTEFLSSKTLKQISREQLLGKYSVTALAYFLMQMILYLVLSLASSQTSDSVAALIVYYAIYFIVVLIQAIFIVGQNYLYLHIARENTCSFQDMWFGFKNYPDKAIGIQFFCTLLYIVFGLPFGILLYLYLSTKQTAYLLPGAVCFLFFAAASTFTGLLFSQALYLLIDRPQERCLELLKQSIRLMKGHKARLFYIQISFAGMYALVVLTMGIGMFWVYPYINMVRANFYKNLITVQGQAPKKDSLSIKDLYP
ncbi:MAG: DUF975 family protein [Lachnospiraceae bacterium]|nr:DUF975 family protein [Lachnospiraceae bacterium]